MIVELSNPVEPGRPALWIRAIENRMTPIIMRYVREMPGDGPADLIFASTGGSCSEGLRLYTALREVPRTIRATILRAQSMAAIVAMAADRIRIAKEGSFFLHPPGCRREIIADMVADAHVTSGNLRHLADSLDTTDELHLDILHRRCGADRETLRKLSDENTTIGADMALKLGLADEVISWS